MSLCRFLAGITVLAVCASAAPALALTFGDVVISESYGSGPNTALCIIDFGTRSYAFSYSFSGTKSGMDMVLDLDVPNTGLDVFYTDWGSWGIFVDDFQYLNTAKRSTTGVYPGWAYYTSNDGETWTPSPVGAGQRTLYNGAWDAWSYTGFDPNTWMPSDPGPVTPIPEPGSALSLLGMLVCAGARLLPRVRK